MNSLWPAMRAAVAETTHEHWHALRLIAPQVDPRTLAAESVAATAAGLVQQPALWTLVSIADALLSHPRQTRRILAAAGITPAQLGALTHQLDALDRTARSWTARAYHHHSGDGP